MQDMPHCVQGKRFIWHRSIFCEIKTKEKKRTDALFMEQMLNFIATKTAVSPIVLLIWGCSDERNNKGLYHVQNP